MRVTWSREASENLVEIEDYIARDNLERAVRFVDALIDHTETILVDNPRSGRVVPEISNPDMRELIYRGDRGSSGDREFQGVPGSSGDSILNDR
jgi:plasmid stabilization system protein ParE